MDSPYLSNKRLLGCFPSFAITACLIFKTFLLLRFSSQAGPPSGALCPQRHPWVTIHSPSVEGALRSRLQPQCSLLRGLSTLHTMTASAPAPKPRLGPQASPGERVVGGRGRVPTLCSILGADVQLLCAFVLHFINSRLQDANILSCQLLHLSSHRHWPVSD